jgi:hypothetical protein
MLSSMYLPALNYMAATRVSFEASFDSKQPPKLEPKLVSALSETKCLFRLFRFYTETKDQQKQFDRELFWY